MRHTKCAAMTRLGRVAVLSALSVTVAAGWSAAAQAIPAQPPDVNLRPMLAPVPEPPLDELEPTVASQLLAARGTFDTLYTGREVDTLRLADGYGALGRLYHAYGLLTVAEICYANARLLAPGEFSWVYLLAELQERQGRLDEATASYEAARRVRSDYPPAAVRLGRLYLQANRLEEARTQFEAATGPIETAGAAVAGLGEVALAERRYADAVTQFETALALVPRATRLHYQMAMAYRGLGELDSARAQLAQAGGAGVRPVDPLLDELRELLRGERVQALVGRLAYGAGDAAGAVIAFRGAVEAAPESAGARINLATALAQAGEREQALAELREALAIDPTNSTARFNLGLLLASGGDPEEGLEYLEAAVGAAPDDLPARQAYARALLDVGRVAEAEAEYRVLIEGDSADERAVMGLADAQSRQGRYAAAVTALTRHLEARPESEAAANALGRLLAAAPDSSVRDGARALELGLSLYERRPVVAHGETIAMALAELGRCDEAAARQQELLAAAERANVVDLASALQSELDRYMAGPPCRPPVAGPR